VVDILSVSVESSIIVVTNFIVVESDCTIDISVKRNI
jgi:hypothetical protein